MLTKETIRPGQSKSRTGSNQVKSRCDEEVACCKTSSRDESSGSHAAFEEGRNKGRAGGRGTVLSTVVWLVAA